MGLSRQEHYRGLPFPSPGDLPDPGVEHTSPACPALLGGFFAVAPPGKPLYFIFEIKIQQHAFALGEPHF